MTSDKLSTYRQKRNFNFTNEPRGTRELIVSNRYRFVIQKHKARNLHYDLRLEMNGVFKSWAVTRGPSLNSKDKRLAVEVEDHPLEYGDFEGPIPEKQYGGGTVMLWDRGYWIPKGKMTPAEALEKGELKFVLYGERLHGGFVLVRMSNDRNGGKRTNWLLIKHKDEFSVEENGDFILNKYSKSVASGRTMGSIASKKGKKPKPFIAESVAGEAGVLSIFGLTAKKPNDIGKVNHKDPVIVSTLPEFIPPQLCKSIISPPSVKGWIHEIKFDGYRIQMRVESGQVSLKTRKGIDWTARFSTIAKAASALPDVIIDGEICALDTHGAPDFSALQAAISEENTAALVFFAFDLLFEGDVDLRDLPLNKRKSKLETLISNLGQDTRLRFVEHFDTEGDAVLKSACRLSLEGIISKKSDAAYFSGRSNTWVKSKCRSRQEVVIGGYTKTNGTFRSLLVGVNSSDHLVYVGRVGTGYSAKVVKSLLPKLQALEASMSPFNGIGAPNSHPDIVWLKPQLVAEIEFAGWTDAGYARQGAFKGLREDKPAAEVKRETSTDFKSGDGHHVHNSSHMNTFYTRGGNAEIMGVMISHPNKPLWPDAGDDEPVSKAELAHYYEAIGPWMIEHLRGRPCSILRTPDGICGGQFFQRHSLQGMSNLLELVAIRGDSKPYLQIDRIEGLAVIAQIGGTELHPWNCQPGNPDNPGRLVFDLDPGHGVEFSAVVAAARQVRDWLEELGLVSFCKTTGGKGLHVVTPLAASRSKPPTWDEAKMFAHDVCANMAREYPELFLIKLSRTQREGRIFLDYLRNDRMATAVAPLSPRARQGATVSMPLNWSQVKSNLDPRQFTIRTVPTLLAKSKVWQDYDDSKRSLAQAIKRLRND